MVCEVTQIQGVLSRRKRAARYLFWKGLRRSVKQWTTAVFKLGAMSKQCLAGCHPFAESLSTLKHNQEQQVEETRAPTTEWTIPDLKVCGRVPGSLITASTFNSGGLMR
jgi:hypothetical protein